MRRFLTGPFNIFIRLRNKINFLVDFYTFWSFQKKILSRRFDLKFSMRKPCLNDKTTSTGFDRHYIYHTAWAARCISSYSPNVHIDISSSLYFCSILSAFVPVKFYDYRPANLFLSNLQASSNNLAKLTFADNSIDSLSCMHTVEHVGLGRYGDELDYDGDIKAIKELSRVLSYGGNLLFVVPVAASSYIQFNAHRIYNPSSIIELFEEFGLKLVEFSLIPDSEDDGGIVSHPSNELVSKQNYACGCFWFSK